MTQLQVLPGSLVRLWGRRVLAFVVPFVAAPFATTGLWRLDLPTWGVYVLCALVVPAFLLLVPKPDSRWLAAGWIAGCLADAMFLLWLFSVMGTDLS